jgi:hypothetical protein
MALAFTGLLHGQEMPKQGVVATGAYIEVSDSLYKTIKDWLLFGNKEQKLADFLLLHHYNEREVLDFLGAYYSGSTGNSNINKAQTTEPCVCNVISPTTAQVDKSTNFAQPNWKLENQGTENYEWFKVYDGMYKSTGLKIHGSQGIQQKQTAKTYLKVELLNLCTVAGLPQTECNCNKPVRVKGEYHRWLDVDEGYSTSWTWWSSLGAPFIPNGREGKFSDAFLITSFDLEPDPNNSINWIIPNIDVNHSNIFSDAFNHSSSVLQIDALLDAAGHLANMLVSGFDFGTTTTVTDQTTNGNFTTNTQTVTQPSTSGFNDLVDALKMMYSPPHSATASINDYLEDVPFEAMLMLKANTPKIVFYATSYSTELRAYGPKFGDIMIRLSSFFKTSHVVDYHPYAYEQNGDLIGQDWDCCNEFYGWWHHTPVTLPSYSNYNLNESVLRNSLLGFLNYPGRDWSYASVVPGTLNQFTADVDLQNLASGQPPISLIHWPQGNVGSAQKCGCENLYEYGNPSSGRLLSPNLFSPDDCIWPNGLVDIMDISFPSALVNQGLLKTYWLFGNAQLQQPNQPLGIPNTSQIQVSNAGVYALVYEDMNSPVCRTISYFNLPQCVGKFDDEDKPQNNLSVYPNPATTQVVVSMGQEAGYEISITNQTGQKVFETLYFGMEFTINLTDWPNGIYFITSIDSKITNHAKFVINR